MATTEKLSGFEHLPTTLATFRFVNDSPLFLTEKPYEIIVGKLPPEQEHLRQNVTFSNHSGVPVQDLRPVFNELSLDKHAVCFYKCGQALDVDVKTEHGLKKYLKMTKDLLLEHLHAEKVVIFDYNVSSDAYKLCYYILLHAKHNYPDSKIRRRS